MDFRLIYAIILTILPISELRLGLPVGIYFSLDNNIPVAFIFCLIVILNILVIFFVFYFLDKLNSILLKNRYYAKYFNKFLKRFNKRLNKFKKRYDKYGFFALMFIVAIPLPGTGAWSGCLISWLLNLNREKSIISISIGVIVAGIFVLAGTIGLISLN